MAFVYAFVNGKRIQKAMGHVDVVQNELQRQADIGAQVADVLLARARSARPDAERAYITVESGDMDRYVVLNHPSPSNARGANTAMSIEYGREAGSTTVNGRKVSWGPAPAHMILHRAMKLR